MTSPHKPAFRFAPRLPVALMHLLLLGAVFALFAGRKPGMFRSETILSAVPGFYSHISNFCLSYILYAGIGFMWLMMGVPVRKLALAGLALAFANVVYETFLPVLNTRDPVDAVYGVAGHGLLLADVCFALAIGLRVLAWLGGAAPVRWHPVHVGWLAYVLALGQACLVSPDILSSAGKWVGVVYLALIAVVALDLASDPRFARRLILTFIVAATVTALFALTVAALALWRAFAWPMLRWDPSQGTGVRLFAGFCDAYASTTMRRLPAFEMTELEFYSWWPLRVTLLAFVANMVVATVRRIDDCGRAVGVNRPGCTCGAGGPASGRPGAIFGFHGV